MAGLTAALAAQVIWTHIDVVSQRLTVQGNKLRSCRYMNGIDAFRKILNTDGPRGLYRGVAVMRPDSDNCDGGPRR
ncbi:putative mitochondrial carrier domain superfamily [Helianthus anomalus]